MGGGGSFGKSFGGGAGRSSFGFGRGADRDGDDRPRGGFGGKPRSSFGGGGAGGFRDGPRQDRRRSSDSEGYGLAPRKPNGPSIIRNVDRPMSRVQGDVRVRKAPSQD